MGRVYHGDGLDLGIPSGLIITALSWVGVSLTLVSKKPLRLLKSQVTFQDLQDQ